MSSDKDKSANRDGQRRAPRQAPKQDGGEKSAKDDFLVDRGDDHIAPKVVEDSSPSRLQRPHREPTRCKIDQGHDDLEAGQIGKNAAQKVTWNFAAVLLGDERDGDPGEKQEPQYDEGIGTEDHLPPEREKR